MRRRLVAALSGAFLPLLLMIALGDATLAWRLLFAVGALAGAPVAWWMGLVQAGRATFGGRTRAQDVLAGAAAGLAASVLVDLTISLLALPLIVFLGV